MIYTKDNIVGVKFKLGIKRSIVTISGINQHGTPVISNSDGMDMGNMPMLYLLDKLNTGLYEVVSPIITPRQQADDLLSEFKKWFNSSYQTTMPIRHKDIQDFLTHKFGE